MERTLALMAGAGTLPARMAAEARRQGWRVVAFSFAGAALGPAVERAVPSRLTELGAVLAGLTEAGASAALFAGKFSMTDVVRTDAAGADELTRDVERQAGSRVDARLADAIITTLAGLGIEVLDQRRFVGQGLPGPGGVTVRQPTPDEWRDVRRGLAVARLLAGARVGQVVVVRHGAVTAAEAVEGTTEAVRRGTALAGPGAVVVKVAAPDHDFRFDTPAVGPETIDVAAAGAASVVAVEAGRVLLLDGDEVRRRADAAGMAVVAVDG